MKKERLEKFKKKAFEDRLKSEVPKALENMNIGSIQEVIEKNGSFSCLNCFGIECGRGWFPIIETAVKKIEALNQNITITQIKEKFGGLRIYTDSYTEECEKIINEAEQAASITCEECGEEGSLHSRGGWLRTVCKKCKREGEIEDNE